MYNTYYAITFNPFSKQQLKGNDHFVSHDFIEVANRLNHLKDVRGIDIFTAMFKTIREQITYQYK